MRLTRAGIFLVVFLIATAVVSIVAPTIGLIMAIVLVVVGLVVLSEGFVTSGSASDEVWTRVEAERKAEALRRKH